MGTPEVDTCQRLSERKMMEKAQEEERCIHQMLPGTCSICNSLKNLDMLSTAFDEVNAETSEDGVPSATILTKICQNAECVHGGAFQAIDKFENGKDICKDCQPESVKNLIKEKNRERAKKKQQPIWSEEDKEFLRQNVDLMRNCELGEKLNRTTAAVSFRLSALGILRKNRKKRSKKVKGVEKVIEDFDSEKFYLGKLCKDNHEHQDSGKSLRRKNSRVCVVCNNKYKQHSEHQVVVDFADHPDLLEALKESAKDSLRDIDKELLWVIKRLVTAGKLKDDSYT